MLVESFTRGEDTLPRSTNQNLGCLVLACRTFECKSRVVSGKLRWLVNLTVPEDTSVSNSCPHYLGLNPGMLYN